jgi:hypothetical protein
MARGAHHFHSDTVVGLPRLTTAARGCDSPPVPRQPSSHSRSEAHRLAAEGFLTFSLGEHMLIPMANGMNALVDATDFPRVSGVRWSANHYTTTKDIYPRRSTKAGGRVKNFRLHRVIVGEEAAAGRQVDHANGDLLENRRSNLRLCTGSQNCANTTRPMGTSGLRGVSRSWKRWKAVIRVGSTIRHLGTTDTPEEAARLYDTAALKLHGEFAVLNFPEAAQ